MAGGLAAHWWIILIIVLLLFGAPRLPALARSMGQSMRIFRSEMKNNEDESKPGTSGTTPAAETGDTAKS
jgi:sec-independent protein translocase protein TatA